MNVYADNAATTRMSQAAVDAMLPFLRESYGNPSSLYTLGQKAAESPAGFARDDGKKYLGCDAREITFTSGGSEADNQALLTAATLGARKGKKHIISTAFEHHAILHSLKRLEKQGFEVTLLDVHENGLVTAQQVADAIREDTCLVTVVCKQRDRHDPADRRDRRRLPRARRPVPHRCGAGCRSSAHQRPRAEYRYALSRPTSSTGPKGVGLLYARKGIFLTNLIEGGGQERGHRAGTENVGGIAGMAAAFREACEHMDENIAKVTALRDKLIDGLSKIPHCALNGDREHRLPGNVNFCFEGIEGESMLLLLDGKGICASSGSACRLARLTRAMCCWPSAARMRSRTARCA